MALQADGKIVVVGRGGANEDFALARYNPNGSLDTSFSDDGMQTTDFGGVFGGVATAVAIQGDGKIVAVGFTRTDLGEEFVLARYTPDGSLDTSFSGDGKQTTLFGEFDEWRGVALQSDGKIVAVGTDLESGDFVVARYNSNGSLDTSFSGDGLQSTDFGGGVGATAVALQVNGRIVVVGGGGAGGDFALARYNPNGALDTSLSGDGRQTTDFGGYDSARALALQADGKIVAVGGGSGDFLLARYNPNGSLDTSFSGDGRQTTNFGGGGEANGVALQADGKIVAVGVGIGPNNADDFALARYLGG